MNREPESESDSISDSADMEVNAYQYLLVFKASIFYQILMNAREVQAFAKQAASTRLVRTNAVVLPVIGHLEIIVKVRG